MNIDGLDLRQLRYFLAVAERRNISAAAREVGITQPALSRQVRAFEHASGYELIVRQGKTLSLTQAGEVMQREGLRIVRAAENALKRLSDEIDGAELRVGYAPSLAAGLIENAMACFTTAYPRVRVSWHDCSTEEMWRYLADDRLDLILEVETDEPTITWQPLLKRQVRVAVPARYLEQGRTEVTARDLDGERLLLLSRHEYPSYWRQVTSYFDENGINAKVAGEFDGITSLRMGVEAGLGLAFVAGEPPGMTTLPLNPDPEPICIAIGHRTGRALAEWERAFIDALQG